MASPTAALRLQIRNEQNDIKSIDAQIKGLRERRTYKGRVVRSLEASVKRLDNLAESAPPQPENVMIATVELAISDWRGKVMSAKVAANTIRTALSEASVTTTQASVTMGKSVSWLHGILGQMDAQARRS